MNFGIRTIRKDKDQMFCILIIRIGKCEIKI